MANQVEKIIYGFLIRLKPHEAAPLFSLVNQTMKLNLVKSMALLEFNPMTDSDLVKQEKAEYSEEDQQPTWGLLFAAQVVDHCAQNVKKPFLDFVEKKDPFLYSSIRPFVFVFQDFIDLDNIYLQKLLIGQDLKELALALYDGDDEIREKFLSNLSQFNQRVVLDELEYLDNAEHVDPASARENILQQLREYAQKDDIHPFNSIKQNKAE